MEIVPTTSSGGAGKIPAKATVAPVPKTGADSVSLGQSEAVNRALQQTPDVRPEAVNRAATLVNDVQYPPDGIVNALGRLLALHEKDSSQSDSSQ